MATKYLENVVTTHYADHSYEYVYAEHVKWFEQAESEGNNQGTDTKNRLKISEIQMNFVKANNQYYKKKFQEALKTYQYTQGLVFQLLYPPYKPGYIVDAMPIKAELFDSFLKIGAEMASSLPPGGLQSSVGYVQLKSLPGDVQKFAQTYDEAGITTVAESVPNDVRNATMLGLEFAKSHEWNTAEVLFKQGLDSIANATSTDAVNAKASLELNLGAVYVQKGDLPLATRLTQTAVEGFKQVGDKVGEAQAKLNMAAILHKQGKTAEAEAMSKEAEALLRAEENGSGGTGPRGGGGTLTPAAVTNVLTAEPQVFTNVLNVQPAFTNAINVQPHVLSNVLSKNLATSINLGTTIKPQAIYDLASTNGGGVLFRLPDKGDGWITQELENNIVKKQKIQAKELGITMGSEVMKFKWTDNTGLNLNDVKTKYYEQRATLKTLGSVILGYRETTDWAVNLPHLYLYQLPVCIADCYHNLREFNKAEEFYLKASGYQFINTTIEVPALWIKMTQNYLDWGHSLYKNDEVPTASKVYMKVITPDDKTPADSPLYKDKLNLYGAQVSTLIASIDNADASTLNPVTINLVMDIRNHLKMINAGLDFFGYPANYFPIFKFDYLQSVATYFAQQAVQAEREYINFTSHGEDEQMTRQQLEQSVELSKAQVDLAQKQVEHANAELAVNKENAEFAELRMQNAKAQKQQYADVSYELAALDAATVFASGPEGYSVSYTYYSPSEGKNVTLEGSDAYKVMEDAAWKKGMLSRDMELANLDRNIAELDANKQLANAQLKAAQVNVDVANQQKKIAEMNKKHSDELLNSFESQVFTPEVWFELGNHIYYISRTYLKHAIGIARKMQKAYELETGRALNAIKGEYNTNIISGLLSADYLLSDINYFTVDRINNSMSKDIPIKQVFSLSELNPMGFETVFKSTGKLQFETSLSDFDMTYPGGYLRKIKKVEMIVEGLLPPGGVHGTMKNSGISRDRKQNGDVFFRIQPCETLYLSNYNPRQDVVIFQPDQRVLDVFENCGVATGWTLEIRPAANDINYQTIADVKMVVYYTAQFDSLLENTIKAQLPTKGEKNTALPFRLLFPDEYFTFIDSGELKFTLYSTDFAFNEVNHKVKNISLKAVMEQGTSAQNLKFNIQQGAVQAQASTNADGMIKSDSTNNANTLNAFIGLDVCKEWSIKLNDADNPGLDRKKIKDLFLFVEYSFTYKA